MSDVCQERSGFLFAHECDWPAQWSCAQCHKPICERHTQQETGERVCVTCTKAGTSRDNEDPDSTAAMQRRRANDPYWYAWWYSGYHDDYYDADDYGAFDSDGARVDSSGDEHDFHGS